MSKDELLNKVPKILRDALSSLGDESRQAILITLLINDEASYSNLLRELDFNDSSTLNYHLKLLLESGLITKIYERREGTRDQSYYTPTEFGQNFFDKLMRVIEEPLERVHGYSSNFSNFTGSHEINSNWGNDYTVCQQSCFEYSNLEEGSVTWISSNINDPTAAVSSNSGGITLTLDVSTERRDELIGTTTTTNVMNLSEDLRIETPEKNKNLEPNYITPLAAI
ncbi:MAG TPA: hypothetical protein ENH23_06025 [candidate division Zixibacteria bacterium]|nr:hypothetical protein [candidate division Zixibacteria bacterium]